VEKVIPSPPIVLENIPEMHALTSRIALLEKELDIQKRVNIEQELRHQVIFY